MLRIGLSNYKDTIAPNNFALTTTENILLNPEIWDRDFKT